VIVGEDTMMIAVCLLLIAAWLIIPSAETRAYGRWCQAQVDMAAAARMQDQRAHDEAVEAIRRRP